MLVNYFENRFGQLFSSGHGQNCPVDLELTMTKIVDIVNARPAGAVLEFVWIILLIFTV